MRDVEIISDGITVWVNTEVCLGRFCRFGIDIHDTQPGANTECLFCTHEETTSKDWELFKLKMKEFHDVDVSDEYKPMRFA